MTLAKPVIDSAMTRAEALAGVDPDCPADVLARQQLVTVEYWGFDERRHRGQVVLDRELVADVQEFFAAARELRFPIESAIPLAAQPFAGPGGWSDDRSMAANNCSAFNYRLIAGTPSLSHHALGRALDVNPRLNPWLRGDRVLPPGARYDPSRPGTFHAAHPLVAFFEGRGWEWGGRWGDRQDYHHFQKPAPSAASG